ncbi:MAG: uroporphyrinogen-III synthase [Myxococcota bacterium]|nr:uroporphyrinogen-III synthase [Myxococcota bacterium]
MTPVNARIFYTGTRPPAHIPEGIELWHAPMLEVEVSRLREEDALERIFLARPRRAFGVVIYSRHAITALERSDFDLSGVTIYCVGQKTAARARSTFPDAYVLAAPEEEQHFEGLAAWMSAQETLPPSILSLGLEGKPRPLAAALASREEEVEVLEIAAYHTTEASDLDLLLSASSREPPADWVVLMSPKGARAWRALVGRLEATEQARWLSIPRAAIGETTATACESLGLSIDFIPPSPDVTAMLEALALGQT